MIAWPDLGREGATVVSAGDVAWPHAGARWPAGSSPQAEIIETPQAGREPLPPADAALEDRPAGLPPSPHRRTRWPMVAALVVSLGAHAAFAMWLAARLATAGMEAETDAISVEIVLEAEPSQAASVAGATQASEGGDEGQAGVAPPVEALAEAPPDEAPAQAPDDEPAREIPVERVEQAAPDERIETALSERADAEPEATAESTQAPVESVRQMPAPIGDAAEAVGPVAPIDPVPPEAGRIAADDEPAGTDAPPVLSSDASDAPSPVSPVAAAPADDIPLDLVPVPMFRPDRTAAAPAREPGRARERATSAPAKPALQRTSAASERRLERQRPERAGADKPGRVRQRSAPPAKAQTAGNAARSAASAGAAAGYARKLNGHLQRHKRYPAEAARQRLKGAVRLSVSIDRSGRLVGARVSGGSGHTVLDREALATARRASPYPRPPGGIRANPLTLTFNLRFGR